MSSTPTPEIAKALSDRANSRAAVQQKKLAEAEKLKNEGNELFKKADFVGACNLYAKAVNVNGPQPIVMANLAAAYNKLKMWVEADWAASLALDYDPKYHKARFRRAIARKNDDEAEQAIADLRQIVNCSDLTGDAIRVQAKEELDWLERNLPFLRPEGVDIKSYWPDEISRPLITDEALEPEVDSDSPDSLHVGNLVPCRHYNRGTCNRGSECAFSHAPDDRSVRDGLGHNVCLNMLTETCKFGETKCVYSHDKQFLPPGAKYVDLPTKYKKKPGLEEFLPKPEEDTNLTPPRRIHDAVVDRLKDANEIAERIGGKSPNIAAMEQEPKDDKFTLLISLEDEPFYKDICQHLYAKLDAATTVVQLEDPKLILEKLDSPGLGGVLVTDAGISRKKYRKVLNKLIEYVKNGGWVAIGGMFSNHVRPTDFAEFFSAWGLAWKSGSYTRVVCSKNPNNDLVKNNPSLLPSYSMKSLYASDITPDQAVYVAEEDRQPKESPAVTAVIGKGRLSYVGDVNAEDGSTFTTLAMLRLRDIPVKKPDEQPSGPTSVGATPPAGASNGKSTRTQAADGPSTTVEQRSQRTGVVREEPHVKPSVTADSAGPKPAVANSASTTIDRPLVQPQFILVLVLDFDKNYFQTHGRELQAIAEQAEIRLCTSLEGGLQGLISAALGGVYITDTSVGSPSYKTLLDAVVKYAKGGGKVVIGGLAPATSNEPQLANIFSAFGLPWLPSFTSDTELVITFGNTGILPNFNSLDSSYFSKVRGVMNFKTDDSIYRRDDESPGAGGEAYIIRARVGSGYVGYIGDQEAHPSSIPVLLGMLNLLKGAAGLVPDRRKFVITLSFSDNDTYRTQAKQLFTTLEKRFELVSSLSNPRIIDLLSSRDLAGVFVAHGAITRPENAYLFIKLVEYAKKGGKVIFGGNFARTLAQTNMLSVFQGNFDLSWDVSSSERATGVLNDGNDVFKEWDFAPESIRMDGLYIKGIEPSMAVYIPEGRLNLWQPSSRTFQSAIVYAEVGKGHVGWFGIPTPDERLSEVVRAMFGLADPPPNTVMPFQFAPRV